MKNYYEDKMPKHIKWLYSKWDTASMYQKSLTTYMALGWMNEEIQKLRIDIRKEINGLPMKKDKCGCIQTLPEGDWDVTMCKIH